MQPLYRLEKEKFSPPELRHPQPETRMDNVLGGYCVVEPIASYLANLKNIMGNLMLILIMTIKVVKSFKVLIAILKETTKKINEQNMQKFKVYLMRQWMRSGRNP
ncbi:hypothetical protein FNV43_RR15024 [Rhamnella rubrinervis]|uniref:Uncharacterized protein n=1 Tax=Rhamnella rubrinervis TaxID=2594499 RepID=A0A8K0E5N1_9ROSA|nr:hypothetical protein FNV43_RR15024 [Rhamnella rubrinervis]